MARLSGTYTETFVVHAPASVVLRHFSNLDAIVANYGPLESAEKVGDDVLKFVVKEKKERGVRFQGRYTCKYTVESETRMSWRTLGNDNMWSTGHADFVSKNGGTEVTYTQTIESEVGVPRILAAFARGVASREIAAGIKAYLARMRAACPTG
ncbi:MAG: SRPBCC family protein [Myxococcales bacterium]|nr:SRPBCC family protein [Myxococcales bacterium]